MSASTLARPCERLPRASVVHALRGAQLRVALTTTALLAASTATVGTDAARWFGVRGPECLLGAHLGSHACPACGLVRSVASTVQGNFEVASAFHPAGPLLVLLGLGMLVADLSLIHQSRESAWHRPLRSGLKVVGLLVLLAGWLAKWVVA